MTKTPIGMIMDMAKKEIGSIAEEVMKNNNIPPDLMIYILESISNDFSRLKNMNDAEIYTKSLQEKPEE